MQVKFSGHRGSVPSPGPHTAKYGGNTSCVEVVANDGTRIVLDCGTGARALGQELAQAGPSALRIHLFIGHIHWDHIQGFPFFVPAFMPETELNVYAPRGFQRNLEEALAGQMQHAYFPLKLNELRSRLQFTQLEEGFFRLGSVLVETQHLNHTAPTIAYRISADGATVVYSTDHEPFWKPGGSSFRHPGDQRHLAFLKDADLVIHDAQYTDSEYPAKQGWGHSTIEYATDVAVAAAARRLALFHHDPTREDSAVETLERMARERASSLGGKTEIFAAAEGLTLEVKGTRRTRQVAQLTATEHRPIAGNCIFIIGLDENESAVVEQEMWEDNLLLVKTPDVRTALAQVKEVNPDLVIVNSESDRLDAIVAELRGRSSRPTLPILILTDDVDDAVDQVGGNLSSTDFLARPFSPPMLRSRVRAWLARSAEPGDEAEAGRLSEVQARGRATPSTREEIRDALSRVSLFSSLSPDELDLLSARATERFFEPGQIMLNQGEQSDHLFVILSGRARVVEMPDDPSHTEMVLGEISTGDVLGEMAALTGMPRSATVTATGPVRSVVIAGGEFLRLVNSAPGLAASLAHVLARRIWETDRRFTRFVPDSLTGLLSRRSFQDQYPRFAAQARRRGTGIVLMMFDIVNLRAINDADGYAQGDEAIRTVSQALLGSSRTTDLVGRWGGDEFVLLPVDAQPEAVDAIVKRLNDQLQELCTVRKLPAVRCAFGAASSEVPPESPDDLIRRADEDMQQRKEAEEPNQVSG